ncbi:Nipped-B-like protein [Varanus komodoensis]|nr:Nipped-B-like protein [Varanus komodoensis]
MDHCREALPVQIEVQLLLKSEEDASYKPVKKACTQLVDNLVEHILKYEESLADSDNKGVNSSRLVACITTLFLFSKIRPQLMVKHAMTMQPYLTTKCSGNAKHCSNYRTIALISHASKVMLKILQARFQQYVDRELPEVQAGFRRGRGTRDQIANICWILEKAREFQKNIYFCFIDYAKAFDCVDHNQLWQVLKEMGVPDHLICLLRNLYAGQEATVRTGHGTTDWFKIEKGVWQGCILSPCLFNLYAEHNMRKAGLDESPVGIKIARRNTSNLRYADDTTLMAESEVELKSFLIWVKE